VRPATRCTGVAIQAIGFCDDVGAGNGVAVGDEVGVGNGVSGDDIGARNGVGGGDDIGAVDAVAARIAGAACNVTAATAPGAPASWPVSQRANHERHPSAIRERAPKRATCCSPGRATPNGHSCSDDSCDT
jgi:hypothetical protein